MVGGPRRNGLSRPTALVLMLGGVSVACELTEVTVPQGDPITIVQSVLSRGASRQFVVVEEAFVGRDGTGGFFDSIPPGGPRIPILGALVTLEYPTGTACGLAADTLVPLVGADGVYRVTGACDPAPGDRVNLTVRVPDGRVVTGSTVMPGARAVTVTASRSAAVPNQEFVFHRKRDTLSIDADAIVARGLQIEARRRLPVQARLPGIQHELVAYAISDSLGISLPGDLINPFEDDSGQVVFRAGITYDVTVALADTNYYDFVRSQSDPITGRGFINRLQGGTGVFGAVEPWRYQLRVVDEIDRPEEGVYRLQGMLDGQSVDVTFELYTDELNPALFAAFIEGTWLDAPIRRSVDGLFGFGPTGTDPNALEAVLQIPVSSPEPFELWEVWTIRGTRQAQGQPFTVDVDGFSPDRSQGIFGTLTMVQMSGPQ